MIAVIIFYIHTVFLIYVFTKNLIEEGRTSAILSAIFVVVIFSVGWTLCEFIMSLFLEPEGLGLLFPRYAISLIFLTALELIFYIYFYRGKIFN